jgi:hypothetical protein
MPKQRKHVPRGLCLRVRDSSYFALPGYVRPTSGPATSPVNDRELF